MDSKAAVNVLVSTEIGTIDMKIPELLAPAGTMEKLKVAVHYGADAVYLGGKSFGLRNLAGNFSHDELSEALSYAHARGVRVFLTVNAFPDNNDLPLLRSYLESLAPLPVDAYIVADPGVLALVREISPDRELHLSTQANTTNWQSVRFWQQQGIKRVNLAREMTLEGIRDTRANVAAELEVFVHGAMCISYSGRCLLSSLMSGRNANKGECSHPCRWGYALVEETRPGQYFPVVEEEGRGTFIFNSRDLCLLPHIPELVESGVDSMKIEGRMKGIYYVASVVRVYRAALDRYAADPGNYSPDPAWMDELRKISNRGYTTGFLLGRPTDIAQEYDSRYLRSHRFVAMVEDLLPDGRAVVGIRNRLEENDDVELIGPGMKTASFTITGMTDESGAPLTVANPNRRVVMNLPVPAARFDMLRRDSLPEETAA